MDITLVYHCDPRGSQSGKTKEKESEMFFNVGDLN